jgi:hypothetical protein
MSCVPRIRQGPRAFVIRAEGQIQDHHRPNIRDVRWNLDVLRILRCIVHQDSPQLGDEKGIGPNARKLITTPGSDEVSVQTGSVAAGGRFSALRDFHESLDASHWFVLAVKKSSEGQWA